MYTNGSAIVIKHDIYLDDAAYSDEALATLARERGVVSEDAVIALLKRYERAVYRACVWYLHDPALAEEAGQEALIRVYRGIHRFQGRSSFRTWLYRIVWNQCCSTALNNARHKVCERLDVETHEKYVIDTRPDSATQTIGDNGLVQAALQGLSPNDREIIRLRFFCDLSLDSIADTMDIKLSAAKMRLYRALEKLKVAYTNLDAAYG